MTYRHPEFDRNNINSKQPLSELMEGISLLVTMYSESTIH